MSNEEFAERLSAGEFDGRLIEMLRSLPEAQYQLAVRRITEQQSTIVNRILNRANPRCY